MGECWHSEKKGGGGVCKYCNTYHSNVAMHWNFCDKNPEAKRRMEEMSKAKPIVDISRLEELGYQILNDDSPELCFMPRQHRHPVSRDYALDDIPCGRTDCICNVSSVCKVPSRCRLDGDGKCTGFQSKGD